MADTNGTSNAEPTTSTPYEVPLSDIELALDVAGLNELLTLDAYKDVEAESIKLALSGFASLAANAIAPTNRAGDVITSRFDASSKSVTTPKSFADAYDQYVKGGWGALPFPTEFGGAGFPGVVGLANQEMFASANMALSLSAVLTQGVIEGLMRWGSEELQTLYLAKLLTGEWCGTMVLTEPESGSDLSTVTTTARQDANGQWRLKGVKIFITWGDHDLVDNIIHLVLARTADAPTGTKGLSLFVVPKFIVNPDGTPGERNTLHPRRIENKMGIHGSPTCEMEFDDAVSDLVGPLHGGMRAMFTVMNAARLSIGMEGPAIAERAFQQARAYANTRLQGRAKGPSSAPIIEHADVRRMLLTMTTMVQAARLLVLTAKAHDDRARHADDEIVRAQSQEFVDLLTPVAKSWSTDIGFAVSSLGVQVLGGTGYMEETGMSQHLRDSRIPMIYEGTNGIQAIDLAMRKLPRDGGKWIRQLIADMQEWTGTTSAVVPASLAVLNEAIESLATATEWMLERLVNEPDDALAGATTYQELLGITLGGWLMAKRVERARELDHADTERIANEFDFFVTEVTARAIGLKTPIMSGARRLAGLTG